MARTVAAVSASKMIGIASRRLGRGGGTAFPGVVAARLDPDLLATLGRSLGGGRALVTGTNGKTTTARMLAGIAEAAGRPVLHNRSGSNLVRGLTATVAAAAGWNGTIPQAATTTGIFEVDEATVPAAAAALRPDVLLFTNLFRDQLDRYGEVDSIAVLWQQALERLPATPTVGVNADDPSVATLRAYTAGPVLTWGIDDVSVTAGGAAEDDHPADARWCAACGTEFSYSRRFFWHVGHWSCPGCGDERPAPDVAALVVQPEGEAARLELRTPAGPLTLRLPLLGLYNVYNALAATAGALALGLPLAAVRSGLEGFTAAFGRQEEMQVRGRQVRLMLCKNPAGVNQVLRTLLTSESDPLRLLLLLNDGIADGRDVSWIWDVDFELLAGRTALAVAAGSRAADMALRLKYAGLAGALAIEDKTRSAIFHALSQTPAGGRLYVLPTYTAMLDVRDQLAALAGRGRFWQQ